MKLIGHELEEIRVTEALDIATECNTSDTAPRNPTVIKNIFENKNVTLKETKKYVDLVWVETDHRGADDKTPNYFKKFTTTPASSAELKDARNQRKLKH
eukprot:13456821-Ditylum_brightwellii.AAC.1